MNILWSPQRQRNQIKINQLGNPLGFVQNIRKSTLGKQIHSIIITTLQQDNYLIVSQRRKKRYIFQFGIFGTVGDQLNK